MNPLVKLSLYKSVSYTKCRLLVSPVVPLLSKTTAGSNAVVQMACDLKKRIGRNGIFSTERTSETRTGKALTYSRYTGLLLYWNRKISSASDSKPGSFTVKILCFH